MGNGFNPNKVADLEGVCHTCDGGVMLAILNHGLDTQKEINPGTE